MDALSSFEVAKALSDHGEFLYVSRERNRVCFLCCSNEGYYHFVIPHLASALLMVPDSVAEALVPNMHRFMSEYGRAYNFLRERFPGRVLVREVLFQTHPHLCRFVYEPELRADYTYIGDVDIITLERGLLDVHASHMRENGVCYSNKKRPNVDNAITGLHCVVTDEYYRETKGFREKMMNPTAWEYVRGRRRVSSFDELVLHDMVYETFPPSRICDLPERPVHGIHVSNHRPASDWGVRDWAEEYGVLCEMDEWKSLVPLMGDKFGDIIRRIGEEMG
jgi:hypothetical protein